MKLELSELVTPIGTLAIGTRDGRLSRLDLHGDTEAVRRELAERFPGEPVADGADPGGVVGRLEAYFAGDLAGLDAVAVDTGGTEFQQNVWRELRRVPPGTTVSYRELARRIGRPRAVRAAAAANGRNPVPIVVPCHRIVAADGTLWGYGGGLERKAWLLAHEGVALDGLRLRRDTGQTRLFPAPAPPAPR